MNITLTSSMAVLTESKRAKDAQRFTTRRRCYRLEHQKRPYAPKPYKKNLSILSIVTIRTTRVAAPIDFFTGVDGISVTTAPEPGTFGLFSAAAIAAIRCVRRRRPLPG